MSMNDLQSMEGSNGKVTSYNQQSGKSFTSRLKMENNIVLEWRNIDYHMTVKTSSFSMLNKTYEDKHILHSISGSAKSGELLAIMGPTGCGKTSLLNILAARNPFGNKEFAKLNGEVLVNGIKRKDEKFRSLSAYVLQDDKLFAHLTVYETLLIAAHFYLPSNLTLEEKDVIVDDIISELGLIKARNTIIGNDKVRGVSGGERRRANIAVQLITNPSVLFLDEPTSGLDSFQAQSVMEAMKAMADNGRLVISVIHQPRSSIYEMFDRLMLLSEGRVMYFGSLLTAVNYFEANGFPCPENFNPSDFFLDVLSPDNRTPDLEKSAQDRIQLLDNIWKSSQHKVDAQERALDKAESRIVEVDTAFDLKRNIQNFKVLAWRSFTEQFRDRSTIILKHVLAAFFGLIIGGIYSGTHHDQQGIQNRSGLLFLIVINQTFNPMFAVINVFPKEKIIVYRERSSKAYETMSYFLAKYFVEIPLNMSPTLLFGIICFWLAGLNPKTFGYFMLILGYHNVVSITMGLLISTLSPSVEGATAIGTPIVIIMVLFGGFYINVDALPIVANWLPYLSFLKWTFEALCINEFVGEEFDCVGSSTTGICTTSGEQELAKLGFGGHTPEPALFGLSMVYIGLLVLLVVNLEISRMKFMPLGYKGSKYLEEDGEGGVKKRPSLLMGGGGSRQNSHKNEQLTTDVPAVAPVNETTQGGNKTAVEDPEGLPADSSTN